MRNANNQLPKYSIAQFGVEDVWEGYAWWEDQKIAIFISKVTVHEDYNPTTGENNIAVLELAVKIDTDVYPPACLAKTSDTTSFDGKMAEAFGWSAEGANHLQRDKFLLQEVSLPVASKAACVSAMGSSVSDGHICAGGVAGKDVCTYKTSYAPNPTFIRDDGSPLLYESYGQRILIGIVGKTGPEEDCGKVNNFCFCYHSASF